MFNRIRKRNQLMTDIADNVLATLTAVQSLSTQVGQLATAVNALQASLTSGPSTSGLATSEQVSELGNQLSAIQTALMPTPAPAPEASGASGASTSSASGTSTPAA